LIVVLVLLGAAALVVMPAFTRGLGGLQLETAARDLVTHMKQARGAAVSFQKVHRVILLPPDQPDGLYEYVITDEFERPLRTIELPRGIRFVGDDQLPAVISFYPNGRSSGGVIVLAYENYRRMEIRLNPITGFGKVVRPSGEGSR